MPTQLQRADILSMMSLLSEAVTDHDSKLGTPRDAAVQTLAALQLVQLRENEVSFETIGRLLGVSRARAYQLYDKLVNGQETPHTLHEALAALTA